MGDLFETYKDLENKLHIYERDHLRYTECLIRQRELLLTNKPEELVRQAFLLFLISHLSEIYPSLIEIVVEYNDVDIVFFRRHNIPAFRPYRPPILLIEVKRNESTLRDHQDQLVKYMKELRCDRGILFNFNEIILFEKFSDESFTDRNISDLISFKDYIVTIQDDEENDIKTFIEANAGSFENFKRLAVKFKYSRATFVSKEFTAPVEGFIFEFNGDEVLFDLVGHYSKKKHSFNQNNFVKLISLLD